MSAGQTRKTKNRQIGSDIVSRPKRICASTSRGDGNIELDDLCWLQIFNRLNIKDLCNTAEVNHQFKRVSKMSFTGRRATLNLQDLDAFSNAKRRRILVKFGDSIKSMRLVGWRNRLTNLNEISRFCAGTMDELEFRTRRFECGDSLRTLFSSLKTLTIHCYSFTGDAGSLFSECQELKVLRLTLTPCTGTTDMSEVAQKYGKLEELVIGDIYNVRTTIALLEMNMHIKKLDMYDDFANRTVYAFASKMDGLEVLVLRHNSERLSCCKNVTELAGLRSLKVLELYGVGPDFVAAIEAMESVPIERFRWVDCPADLQFFDRIGRWKSLKRLELPGISLPLGGSLAELIEQLPFLHELELGFKKRNEPIRCFINLVERFPKLDALAIHTKHPQLFDQQFYDALLEVILKRRCSSGTKSFKVSIYCRHGVTHRLQMHRQLQVIFLGYENDSLGHCVCFELDVRRVRSYDKWKPFSCCGERKSYFRLPNY